MPPTASALVVFGIPALAVVTLSLVFLAILRAPSLGARPARAFALSTLAFLLYSAGLALSGVLAGFHAFPPPMLLLVIPALALPIALAFSPIGTVLARETPVPLLVGFHAFRLPLELVMHRAALEGTMPAQMTFPSGNFDIVTGATAIVVALLAAQGRAPRALLVAWNLLGSLLLATILAIAIASLPLFHAFGDEPARVNTWVAYFPFVWLPAGLVTSALFGHALLFRRLHGAAAHADTRSQPRPALSV